MKRKPSRKEKRRIGKTVLRLPDLEVAKSAVLNSLSCPDAQRGYRHAIDEFVEWCSEPRLSFSKTVVVRYRNAPGNPPSRFRSQRRVDRQILRSRQGDSASQAGRSLHDGRENQNRLVGFALIEEAQAAGMQILGPAVELFGMRSRRGGLRFNHRFEVGT